MGNMFDDDGRVRDRDALRSLQFREAGLKRPQAKVVDGLKHTPVLHDANGAIGGELVEHPSGQQDATVFAQAAAAGTGAG